MHENSMTLCRHFVDGLLTHFPGPLAIADVGAQDLNGCYRGLFIRDGWNYTGFDIVPAKNVDVVLAGPENWQLPEKYRGAFDVVISGQCLEHVAAPWVWIKNVSSLCKPGAILWISAPNTEVFHEHPIDAWRVWPDGLRALLSYGGFETIVCRAVGPDTFAIARKSCREI